VTIAGLPRRRRPTPVARFEGSGESLGKDIAFRSSPPICRFEWGGASTRLSPRLIGRVDLLDVVREVPEDGGPFEFHGRSHVPVGHGEIDGKDPELADRLGSRDRFVGTLDRPVDRGEDLWVLGGFLPARSFLSSCAGASGASPITPSMTSECSSGSTRAMPRSRSASNNSESPGARLKRSRTSLGMTIWDFGPSLTMASHRPSGGVRLSMPRDYLSPPFGHGALGMVISAPG